MKNLIIIFIALGLSSLELSAQQGMMLKHYMFNKNYFNPSEISQFSSNTITLNYRNQWLGVDDAPVTFGGNISLPNIFKELSVGLSTYSDVLGNIQRLQMEGDIAYSLKTKNGSLNFGFKISMNNLSFRDRSWLTPDTPVDQDNSIVQPGLNSWSPSFSVGMSYYTKKWNIGLSVLNIMESENQFDEIKISQKREYFITSGGRIKINSKFYLLPELIVYSDLNYINFSVNMNTQFDNNLITGLGYNHNDSFSLLVGYRFLKSFTSYYSFDVGISRLSSFARTYGSHELTLRYEFTLPEKVEKSKKNRNVRFL